MNWRLPATRAVLQFTWSFKLLAGWLFLEEKATLPIRLPLQQLENRYNRRGARAVSQCARRMGVPALLGCTILLFSALSSNASDQPASAPADQSAATASIVERLVESNKDRADRLPDCTSKRHYHIHFHGLGRTMVADMDVEVLDHGSASRTFHITSQSGSHVLLDHVLKKLLKSEEEAAQHKNATGLTPENYRFTLMGNANEDGRQLFILQVEPKTNEKLLYRGRIWVDASDFAVVKVEAQPAENPSFWIRSTEIHHVYSKVGDFWLAQRNVSESKTRFGGTATLTIDYADYEFEPSKAKSALPNSTISTQ